MIPLVRASHVNTRFRRAALSRLGFFALGAVIFGLGIYTGVGFLAVVGTLAILICGAAAVTWLRALLRASGRLPLLAGELSATGLALRSLAPRATRGVDRGPKRLTIPRGEDVWITEVDPHVGSGYVSATRPYEYWLKGPTFEWGFGSHSRLSVTDLAGLENALRENGNEVHNLVSPPGPST